MTKVIRKTNFRLVVEPKRLGDYGAVIVSDSFPNKTIEQIEKDYQKRCEEMAKEIKRHVENVDRIEIDYDATEVCSHCGLGWETEASGEPLCCDKTVKEWEAQKSFAEGLGALAE